MTLKVSKYFLSNLIFFYRNKKIKIKKRGERKNILWSQRRFFWESFLTYLKLDNYNCPIFKFTKNFPEKKKYEMFESFNKLEIPIFNFNN